MEDRIVIARGFKVARDTFNDFLTSNGAQEILTSCIWEDDEEEIVGLFKAKGIDCPVRICIPEAYPFDHSDWLYICYTWAFMLSHKKIDNLLDENVPSSFEDLRQLLKADEPIATYVMNCKVVDRWEPEALAKRYEEPLTCDICGEVFEGEAWSVWAVRQEHRREMHGATDVNPLPENT